MWKQEKYRYKKKLISKENMKKRIELRKQAENKL